MSKPISFGFGKPKGSSNSTSAPFKASILPSSKNTRNTSSVAPKRDAFSKVAPTLQDDDDENRDDEEPKHEELTGFSNDGAILSKPVEEKKVLVIENAGNMDWRRRGRGKNLLPQEVQAARSGQDIVMVEKDEVSTASGLQLAEPTDAAQPLSQPAVSAVREVQAKSADEEALQALLAEDGDKPRGSAIIEAQADAKFGASDELEDSIDQYPASSTLEEYAAMPVEEFGMAMLRGMGKKRRANGEVIQLDTGKPEQEKKKRKQEGFLGIGAKPAPGMEGVEIGAWGKADMRKNNRGTGFFTPVMVRDAKTGETITEEELELRAKVKSSRPTSPSRRSDANRHGRPSENRDRNDSSRPHRSRSRDRQRRPRYGSDEDEHNHDGEKHSRSSSKYAPGRERARDRDRDRDYGKDTDRNRDRDTYRDRDRHKQEDRDRYKRKDRDRSRGRYDSSLRDHDHHHTHRRHRDGKSESTRRDYG